MWTAKSAWPTVHYSVTGKGRTGKETWQHRTVENILSDEKYKGDTRLQKCYTVDFLSKKRKTNEGEVPQYYVEGSHDAIIESAEWQLVQTEIQRRKNAGRSWRR